MRAGLLGERPGNALVVIALLALFAGLGVAHYWQDTGDDLASSYVGCRLLVTGNADHLYAYDPQNFAAVGYDDPWQTAADEGGFTGFLHPYVQTPLWAYALRPVCMRTNFATFDRIFAALMMFCFAGVIWSVAREWAPDLLNPYAVGLILLVLWFSEPFRYAMFLMQTHVLFMLLTLGALMLAERNRPGWAGLLLACATAVKITPGFLIIYWLLTRRWRAVLSMAAWSTVLWGVTLALAGPHLMATYLADLHRISRILLVSQNNQSFAAWCMRWFYPREEVFDIRILLLPTLVRAASMLLMLGCTVAGGVIDARLRGSGTRVAPIGAMMALVGATLFAPIAWTHYFIVLLAPLMVLLQEGRRLRSWWIVSMVLVGAALNLQPIAGNVEDGTLPRFSLLQSHFYSGVLCLGTLAFAALQIYQRERAPEISYAEEDWVGVPEEALRRAG